MRVRDALRAYARDARSAFAQAPVEVVLAVGLALTFSIAFRDDGGEEWWARVFAGVVLALFPVFALKLSRRAREHSAAEPLARNRHRRRRGRVGERRDAADRRSVTAPRVTRGG